MKKKILIFTATYNESKTLKLYFEEIYKLNLEFDLLIIDDNSPDLTWKKLQDFEKEDNTTGSKELACSAGVCEVVDIEST